MVIAPGQEKHLVPRFNSNIPVSLYVNGRQVPPIEADGQITSISISSLQLRCECKIPIPSKGQIRFSFGERNGEFELNVSFVQRVELSKSIWPWKVKKTYEMQAALDENAKEIIGKYQDYLHKQLFGRRFSGLTPAHTSEDAKSFD